ncbi:LAMI_0A02256g1_1 [Lachancea mirantina]|uniref:LAMI_0A02256g1_1 n=1 Tax=Lachancea mirantina TaxID=1230905 RepID=A0A1G4IMX6_9SACH|nr:LAMI_0A02256g1_1 [Lachancea mirantina]
MATINTRKFSRITQNNLFKVIREAYDGSTNQTLILQREVLPLINDICTFSQLQRETNVNKVMIEDNESLQNLNSDAGISSSQLLFVIDVRSDLAVKNEIKQAIQATRGEVIYLSWDQEPSDRQGKLLHYLNLELGSKTKLRRWNVLPRCFLDDNLLTCNVLYNVDSESLYVPKTFSMSKVTRHLLTENLVNAVQSILQQTGLFITQAASFGPNSHAVVDLLKKRLEERKTHEEAFIEDALYGNQHSGLQCNLIVLERQADFLTPLLSQLTYAGIVDDLYTMKDKKLENPPKLDDVELRPLDYLEDEVWRELKFKNFGVVGPRLNEMAKDLQKKYDERHKAESVGEIKEFVENLSGLQDLQKTLKMHTALSSNIVAEVSKDEEIRGESIFNRVVEFEQDLVAGNMSQRGGCDKLLEFMYEDDLSESRILRLCSLFSLVSNGIREREHNLLKTELVDSFGINILLRLERLTRAGLFLSKSSHGRYGPWRDFHALSSAIELLPQSETDGDPANPKDASFAYCGIVPVTTRLVQLLYDRSFIAKTYSAQQPFMISRTPSWRGLEDFFSQEYGPNMAREQVWDRSDAPTTKHVGEVGSKVSDPVLVVFLGGVTLGEVACLQFLSDQLRAKGIRKRFIVLCDGLTGGIRIPDV